MPHPATKPTTPYLLDSLHRHILLGRLDRAVDTLPLLARRGLRPPAATLSALLRACLRARAIPLARRLHLFLRATGYKHFIPSFTPLANRLLSLNLLLARPDAARHLFDMMSNRNVYSYNAMLAGYAKLGMLRAARRLFDGMAERDVVSWNTMVFALARAGSCREAVGFYVQLRRTALGFNPHTFSGLLMACVRLGDQGLVRQVHGQLMLLGFLSNLVISSSLLDAYAKCGCLEDGRKVFDEMKVRDVLAWTTLVYGYAKSGDLFSARKLFDVMPERNPVSWTALIGGYARHGLCHEALELFRRMMNAGVTQDQFTFSSCLCACATIACLRNGKQIHARLLRTRFNSNAIVLSSLIDMYSKCGDLVGGRRVFDSTPSSKRDVVMWNTMLSALGQHGHGRVAIGLFEEMIKGGTMPDANTFVVLLTACSHSGLVAEGVQFFESMSSNYGIIPDEEHYLCLVDLLGRAGQFDEAVGWLKKMPSRSSARVWNALLGTCRTHGNLQLGKEAAEQLIELEPQSPSAYVLLSNIYAEGRRWEMVEKLRHSMEDRKLRKERAASWIEIDNVVHTFGASDQLHPLREELFSALEQLLSQMEDVFSIT